MVILLSADPDMEKFKEGDQFLGFYTIGDTSNLLTTYQTCSDKGHEEEEGGFSADLAANQSSYFKPIQTVNYEYYITNDPTPQTDRIIVTNNAGAPTIYYFQKGGFCSHSWNNAFFHRGACRRGGTTKTMNIERPDFYINEGSYIKINRIDDNAYIAVSKDNYMRDENEADFKTSNLFSTGMFLNNTLLVGILDVIKMVGDMPGYLFEWLVTGSNFLKIGGSAAQYMYTQKKYADDTALARNAENVSDWVEINDVPSPNRIILSSDLADTPRQNDIYAVIDKEPEKTKTISKKSRNSTRVYVDYTGSPSFGAGDYVFLRTECHIISDTGEETFGSTTHKWIEVEKPFQFTPLENEEMAFIYADGEKLPSTPLYYCCYLNKPKVIRIEIKDKIEIDKNYWTRIEYEYAYSVQGIQMIDSFDYGGFIEDNIEGPYNHSFEASDISLRGTVITTGIANIDGVIDLFKDSSTFSYDEKTFHKGEDTVIRMRKEKGSMEWLFVSKTVNAIGKPCFNAGYYGVIASFHYEGGNPTLADGGAYWRKKIDYRYDVYGRPVRTRITSSSLEGKKTQCTWTQYVGSSPAIDNLCPLDKFEENYLSGNYQQILNTRHALGLAGATIEEVDAQGTCKKTFNGFDANNLNLVWSDTIVIPSLRSFVDIQPDNTANFKATYIPPDDPGNPVIRTDPDDIYWKYGESEWSNDWSKAQFDEDDVSSHAITRFEYDETTNNLIKIIKPLGNEINISYGTSWKSSYIVKDYKTLDDNIGGTTQYVVTSYDYDIKGRLITKTVRLKTDTDDDDDNMYTYGTSAQKTVTQYTYDGMDRMLTKTIGDGTTQTAVLKREYLDEGDGSWENPYTIDTDYLGFRTKSYYDSRYRLVAVKKYKPNQDISGNLDYSSEYEVLISSEKNIYEPGIEKIAQAIKYTNADEAASHTFITKNSYDSIGRLTKVEVKNTDANYEGDSVFRTIQEITYDETINAVVTKKFLDDTTGNFIQTRVENDWLGRGPVKEITWTGLNGTGVQRVTISHYKHDGKLIKKELPNKEAFLYSYDNLGKLEKITYPDGKRTRMFYDLNGNLVQTIARRDISTEMSYNDSDMVVEKKTVDSVRGDTVITTTYTQFGPAKIAQKEDEEDIVENDYWYHWSGKVSNQQQTIDTYTMQIENTFDAAGNQITIKPTGSGTSPWTQTFNIIQVFHPSTPDNDNFNRIAITDDTTPTPINIITYEQDFLGLAANIKYWDYDDITAKMSYTYDKFLRVKTLESDEGTPNLDITLTRDFIGNITRRQEPAQSPAPAIDYNYTYDGMNHLSSGESETNTYDELSNLITKGTDKYVYQDPDDEESIQMRLASFNDGTQHDYTYDDNSNPMQITNRFSSLSYDNLNMLRQIVHSQTDDYWYNAAGLRVKKVEDSGGTPVTTYTLYDGDNILMQEVYNGSTRVQVMFNIIANGKILAQYKRVYPSTDSVVYFYLNNLNSRRVVLDSSGTAIDRYRYSAWGEATQDTGSDDYRSFTGKEYDASGLIYFIKRYYDADTSRFLTEDKSMIGTNWYTYCDNNPVNYVDDIGMDTIFVTSVVQTTTTIFDTNKNNEWGDREDTQVPVIKQLQKKISFENYEASKAYAEGRAKEIKLERGSYTKPEEFRSEFPNISLEIIIKLEERFETKDEPYQKIEGNRTITQINRIETLIKEEIRIEVTKIDTGGSTIKKSVDNASKYYGQGTPWIWKKSTKD
jgi:RHS repeat-associated protein